MPTPRVLLGMTLGALVASLGALFLGEYEFDELLPILSGALLGLIVAEVVVSVGKLRALPLAVMVAAWSATAVVLAGVLDSNETEPIKSGAYLSAALAALAALARANDWKRTSKGSAPGGDGTRSGEEALAVAEDHDDVVDVEPAPRFSAPAPRPRRPAPTPAERGQARPDPRPARREVVPVADEQWMERPTRPVASGPSQRRQRVVEDAPPAIPTAPVPARVRSSRRLDVPAEPRRDAGADSRRRPRPQSEEARVRATPRRRPRNDQDR